MKWKQKMLLKQINCFKWNGNALGIFKAISVNKVSTVGLPSSTLHRREPRKCQGISEQCPVKDWEQGVSKAWQEPPVAFSFPLWGDGGTCARVYLVPGMHLWPWENKKDQGRPRGKGIRQRFQHNPSRRQVWNSGEWFVHQACRTEEQGGCQGTGASGCLYQSAWSAITNTTDWGA